MIPKNELPKIVSLKQFVEYKEKQNLEKTLNKEHHPEIMITMLMLASITTHKPIQSLEEMNNIYQAIHKHQELAIQAQTKERMTEMREHEKKASSLILQLKTKIMENQYILADFNEQTQTINTDDETKTHFYDKMAIGFLCSDDS